MWDQFFDGPIQSLIELKQSLAFDRLRVNLTRNASEENLVLLPQERDRLRNCTIGRAGDQGQQCVESHGDQAWSLLQMLDRLPHRLYPRFLGTTKHLQDDDVRSHSDVD